MPLRYYTGLALGEKAQFACEHAFDVEYLLTHPTWHSWHHYCRMPWIVIEVRVGAWNCILLQTCLVWRPVALADLHFYEPVAVRYACDLLSRTPLEIVDALEIFKKFEWPGHTTWIGSSRVSVRHGWITRSGLICKYPSKTADFVQSRVWNKKSEPKTIRYKRHHVGCAFFETKWLMFVFPHNLVQNWQFYWRSLVPTCPCYSSMPYWYQKIVFTTSPKS